MEDITVYGNDVWIVDAYSDKVYKYANAATRTSGSQNATSSFTLNSANTNPKGMVTDGTYLWVVNDSTTDYVFKYTMAGQLVGSWKCSGTFTPTGITIDPANVSDIWIVDSSARFVLRYSAGTSLTSGSSGATVAFALAAGNTNPQGIADPPAPGSGLSAGPAAVSDDAAAQTLLAATWDAQPRSANRRAYMQQRHASMLHSV